MEDREALKTLSNEASAMVRTLHATRTSDLRPALIKALELYIRMCETDPGVRAQEPEFEENVEMIRKTLENVKQGKEQMSLETLKEGTIEALTDMLTNLNNRLLGRTTDGGRRKVKRKTYRRKQGKRKTQRRKTVRPSRG